MTSAEQPVRYIHFSDTTLRDGEQMPGAALNAEQKVAIAIALREVGVASIDAGFPACGPSEIAAVRAVAAAVPDTSISALCRTRTEDVDRAWEALSDADPAKRSVSLFVATSPVHRESKLKKSVPELIAMATSTITYAREHFPVVAFSAEDATRTEVPVLCEIYREAIDAGARVIGLPDTVGVMRPSQVRDLIRQVQDSVPQLSRAILAVHFHNDLGLATANALAAIEEGVNVVQGTVNGIGERAGNTSLEEFAMLLALHGESLGVRSRLRLEKLWSLSRLVSQLTGIGVSVNKAVVGENVFATSAGIHQDGLLKNPETYLPFLPETVGAPPVRLVLGKHSGRAAIARRMEELGLHPDETEWPQLMQQFDLAPKHAWENDADLLRSTLLRLRSTPQLA